MKIVTAPHDVLRAYVTKFPTQAQAARSLGISRQRLHHILSGLYGLSDDTLARLGLERVVIRKSA